MGQTDGSEARAASTSRERMERAAARLLIDEGPAAVTHRRVAEAADVPRGSANYYFATRAELYAVAVRAAEARRLDAARAAAARSDEDTAALLIAVWYAPHVGPDVVRARLEPMLDALHDPELRAIMAVTRPELLGTLGEVLARSGYRAEADVELIALVLDSALLYENRLGVADELTAARAIVARVLALMPRLDTTDAANPNWET